MTYRTLVRPIDLAQTGGDSGDITGEEAPAWAHCAPALCVFGKDRGGVVIGIHGDGKKNEVGSEAAVQVFLQECEIRAEARADIRQRAAGIDEIDREDFATQFGAAEDGSGLIGELKTGKRVSDFERFFGGRNSGVRTTGLADGAGDGTVFQDDEFKFDSDTRVQGV